MVEVAAGSIAMVAFSETVVLVAEELVAAELVEVVGMAVAATAMAVEDFECMMGCTLCLDRLWTHLAFLIPSR